MGEALDAIITRKRTGPKWERSLYSDRPRDGWKCLVLADSFKAYYCTIEPTLWGVYLVTIRRDSTNVTAESAEIEDVRAAIRTAERLIVKVAGWKFWDEKRRAALDIPSYR